MSYRIEKDAVILICDTCQEEVTIPPDCRDWGSRAELAGWVDITTGNPPVRFDLFHFCSRDHAAAWRAGKGKRRKIARVVEYGAEVKEIEL
jgi:hypothetical protein